MELIASKISKAENGDFKCIDCGKMSARRSNIMEHIEGHHVQNPGHTCDICYKFCPTSNALRMHRRRYHK